MKVRSPGGSELLVRRACVEKPFKSKLELIQARAQMAAHVAFGSRAAVLGEQATVLANERLELIAGDRRSVVGAAHGRASPRRYR